MSSYQFPGGHKLVPTVIDTVIEWLADDTGVHRLDAEEYLSDPWMREVEDLLEEKTGVKFTVHWIECFSGFMFDTPSRVYRPREELVKGLSIHHQEYLRHPQEWLRDLSLEMRLEFFQLQGSLSAWSVFIKDDDIVIFGDDTDGCGYFVCYPTESY